MTDTATPLLFDRDENFASRFGAGAPPTKADSPFADEPIWVVADWTTAREVLSDGDHFSRGQVEFQGVDESRMRQLRAGNLLSLDPPDHTRLRRMLTGEFTVKRIKSLEPRIAEIVADHLDQLEQIGPPADLVAHFALAIPSLVICELLGVPYEDREAFQHRAAQTINFTLPLDVRRRVGEESRSYMGELVQQHRRSPGDDLLSRLIRKHASSGSAEDLTDDELIGISNLLLIAGHETTSNMLALGTLALLRHPDQLAVIRDEPDAVADAVEELLRYLSVVHNTLPRVATAEVAVGSTVVDQGDLVAVSLPAANRDPALLEDGGSLDVTRSPSNHLAFGHGIHHCLGAPLARIEMQIAFPALFRRFPRLVLVDAADPVPYRTGTFVHGVTELPVTW